MSNLFDGAEVIYSYTIEQAINDGVLVPLVPHRWATLTGGKPLVATANFMAAHNVASAMEVWNLYVGWRTKVMPTLAPEDQMFVTTMNGADVWLIEDGAAFTILFPSDY
jgi:hypothetical protein